ncbi:hypothetical protein MASR2M18_07300 [Ignavibacteria bacterium]|nr:peptidylprolyl isomerase [Bacteroidota bacterium]
MKYFLRIAAVTTFLAVAVYGMQAQKKGAKPAPSKSSNPQYIISASQNGKSLGDITIELFPDAAPKHCANFDSLVSIGFYDHTAFHRVIPGFMIQGGDPNSRGGNPDTWGYGDPSLKRVPAEFSKTLSHTRGIISAARSNDPNSATSQFFICVADPTFLDGQYSIFGKVLSGMEVADKIAAAPRGANDRPNDKIEMIVKRVTLAGAKSKQPVNTKNPAKKK